MESLAELKSIIDNAPDSATHIDNNGIYLKYDLNKVLSIFHVNYKRWQVASPMINPWRSLSDIKRIVELMEVIESLPDTVNTEIYLKGLYRPTEFAISQAKSFAIGSVFDSIRNAKKMLLSRTG